MELGIGALLSVALGAGLAAATGFRVFLPLLIAAIAARSGVLPLTDGFAWLASTPALVTLGTAAVLETLAYYVPGVDHALDVLASPAALAAGVLASAAVMADVGSASSVNSGTAMHGSAPVHGSASVDRSATIVTARAWRVRIVAAVG